MIKHFVIAAVVVCLLFACTKKPVSPPSQEPPHTKKTTFKLFLGADYSAAFYDSTYAQVELDAYKESTADGSQILAWDTVLPRQRLKLFPSVAQPLQIIKSIPDMYDSKQRIRIITIIKYDNRGTNQVAGSRIPFTTGVDTMLVEVPL